MSRIIIQTPAHIAQDFRDIAFKNFNAHHKNKPPRPDKSWYAREARLFDICETARQNAYDAGMPLVSSLIVAGNAYSLTDKGKEYLAEMREAADVR